MDCEWTSNEEMALDLQGDGQHSKRYCRKKGQDGGTPGSAQRLSKTPRVATDVKEEKDDLFRPLLEVNHIQEDIERDMKETCKRR